MPMMSGAPSAGASSGMGSDYFPMAMGASGIGSLLSGMFGNSSAPYKAAQKAYQPAIQEAKNYQNPFYNAGTSAIPQYQQYLQGMSDPTKFINSLMGGYQESPYAKYEQDQAMRSATNMGSATGLTGSTPLTQFAQQNAEDISSKDMNQWLQNVLGINTQYGQGLQHMTGMGQLSANELSNLANSYGQNMSQLAYNQSAAKQNQQNNLFGGLGSLGSLAFMAFA